MAIESSRNVEICWKTTSTVDISNQATMMIDLSVSRKKIILSWSRGIAPIILYYIITRSFRVLYWLFFRPPYSSPNSKSSYTIRRLNLAISDDANTIFFPIQTYLVGISMFQSCRCRKMRLPIFYTCCTLFRVWCDSLPHPHFLCPLCKSTPIKKSLILSSLKTYTSTLLKKNVLCLSKHSLMYM